MVESEKFDKSARGNRMCFLAVGRVYTFNFFFFFALFIFAQSIGVYVSFKDSRLVTTSDFDAFCTLYFFHFFYKILFFNFQQIKLGDTELLSFHGSLLKMKNFVRFSFRCSARALTGKIWHSQILGLLTLCVINKL